MVPAVAASPWPAALDQLRASGFVIAATTPDADAMDVGAFVGTSDARGRVAVLLGTGGARYNLAGFYTPPDASSAELAEYGTELSQAGVNSPEIMRDRVYALERDANRHVWAHEYRHRAGSDYEDTNRLRDAYYAGSRPVFDSAVGLYQNRYPDTTLPEIIKILASMAAGAEGRKSVEATGVAPSVADRFMNRERWEASRRVNAPWMNWVSEEERNGR